MISSHRREYSVGLAVEFAMVQDTRVTGLVGLGEPLFDCVHHLALSQLKTYDEKLPFTRLWGGEIESCVGRTRVFCTNLRPYSQLKLESSEREARLLQIFRDVNRLFQEGKILLEAMPSQLADLVALNLGECEWRAQGPVVEESRWVGFTDGCEWLSTLFAASWGPANKFGLVGQRSTIREASQEITREVANRYMEVPHPGSRSWASSGCFFSLSRDVLRDSVRFIDWLLSLWSERVRTAVTDERAALSNESRDQTRDRQNANSIVGHRRNSEELFKSALRTHHRYNADGSVMNYEPITPRGIETLLQNAISDTTASRLFNRNFGSIDLYKQACINGSIGRKLVIMLGDGLRVFGVFSPIKSDVEDTHVEDSDVEDSNER